MDFLIQYQQVRDAQPRMTLLNFNHENSDFCNYSGYNKNSYMLFGSEHNDEAMYGTWDYFCTNTLDSDFCYKSELCYQCVNCTGCYDCNYCQDCENVTSSSFCYDCTGCTNCFGCVGLRHQQYHIFNKPYTPEEYAKKVRELWNEGIGSIYKQYNMLQRQVPRKYMHELQAEGCTGDYIFNSRNTLHSFDVRDSQDCFYINNCIGSTDSIDCSNNYFGCEQNYEVMSAINSKQCEYCFTVFDSQDLLYCDQMWNCHDCMGCSTLKRKEYHIFNKPYSKEAYFKERERLVDELKVSKQYGKHLPSMFPDPLVYPLS